MSEILNFIFKVLNYFVDNKIIDIWVAIILAVSVILIYLSLLRIDYITRLFGMIKNRKESFLINIMQDEYLSAEAKYCACQELVRIKNKKLCGFDDVIRQAYCINLASRYHDLISIFFFRKFRTNIVVGENQTPLIKVGIGIWFGWGVGMIYTLQFFALAIFFISLSIFNPGQLPLWKHAILYLFVVVLLWTGVMMSKQFPSFDEIKLLKELKRREKQATN